MNTGLFTALDAFRHDFSKSLARVNAENDFLSVYSKAFPGLHVGPLVIDLTLQRSGIDRYVGPYAIEEKVRHEDYGDILLEVWSCEETRSKGWSNKLLACDYLNYIVLPARTAYLFEYPTFYEICNSLLPIWVESADYFKPPPVANRRMDGSTYHSINVAVPWKEFLKLGGNAVRKIQWHS